MEKYDVLIVGAGPAGLRCAEILSRSDKSILLIEKNQEIGPKICAGGITRKSMQLMDIPDEVIEYKISKARIVGPRSEYTSRYLKEPFAFMINREQFGQWQAGKLENNKVKILTGTKVTGIRHDRIVLNNKKSVGYRYLVGADGTNSIVRRFLGLPSEKKLFTLQYRIPANGSRQFEVHMNNRYFRSGYGWIFPHPDFLAVGCLADPRHVPVQTLKKGFHRWLKKEGFDLSHAVYESFPISYDYRGFCFGNIFLTGDAAGLASGLTGEGIYAALVSGEETARKILDPAYPEEKINALLHYKKVQERFLSLLHGTGPLRQMIFHSILFLMNNKRFNRRVTDGFS